MARVPFLREIVVPNAFIPYAYYELTAKLQIIFESAI